MRQSLTSVAVARRLHGHQRLVEGHWWRNMRCGLGIRLPQLPHFLRFGPDHMLRYAPLCSALSLLADQFQGHKVGIPVGLYSVLAMSSRLVGALRSWRHCKVADGTAEQWKHYLDLCGCHGKNNCRKKWKKSTYSYYTNSYNIKQ